MAPYTLPAPVVMGIDVGSTKILVGFVGRDGIVYNSKQYPMDLRNQQAAVGTITSSVKDFLSIEWEGPQPQVFGIGVVGHTNPQAGLWVGCMNIPIVTPVPICSDPCQMHGIPGAIDNDVHAATLAELHFGVGRQESDFIYINIGTGIAAGLVCNGQLIRGASNYAGEIGHMVVEPHGDPCECGNRGCLESLCSGGGIKARVLETLPDCPESVLQTVAARREISFKSVYEESEKGDPLACRIIQRACRGLETTVISLVNALNPACIVLGGGAVDYWLIEWLNENVRSKILPTANAVLKRITASSLKVDRVGVIGASVIGWECVPGKEQ